jgi:hypothetical protein
MQHRRQTIDYLDQGTIDYRDHSQLMNTLQTTVKPTSESKIASDLSGLLSLMELKKSVDLLPRDHQHDDQAR